MSTVAVFGSELAGATFERDALTDPELITPIDLYLARQRELSAVEHFAACHDSGDLLETDRYFRHLLPAAPPGPGQQYAFEVDLDACTGCKACVTACRSLNGLDADESWRSVGLLHGGAEIKRQFVTAGCHHCVEPACLAGCPVNAYDKDPITGIVSHLDDQCIGCSYCTLMCPYEVPRYNARQGIVRKCDMCKDRLAVGEAPACVQSCPNEAIAISVVTVESARSAAQGTVLVPGAPLSTLTTPTTVYKTDRCDVATMRPADEHALAPAMAHPPLAVMLVLTQVSVGAFVADLLRKATSREASSLPALTPLTAVSVAALALGASLAHLGRPKLAYRALIGLRHSWLSREILAFGGFAGLASLYAVTSSGAVGIAAAATGLVAVVCSAMIYARTKRVWWRLRTSGSKFLLTSAVTGAATVQLTSSIASLARDDSDVRSASASHIAVLLIVTMSVKLAVDGAVLAGGGELRRTARLLREQLRTLAKLRLAAGLAGGVAVPALLLATDPDRNRVLFVVLAALGALLVLTGELVERHLFFRASVRPGSDGS